MLDGELIYSIIEISHEKTRCLNTACLKKNHDLLTAVILKNGPYQKITLKVTLTCNHRSHIVNNLLTGL